MTADIDFENLTPTGDVGGSIFDMPEPESSDDDYDQPDSDFISRPSRPRGAKTYEKKVTSILNVALRSTINNEKSRPDAAAIIMYGPHLSEKAGDLAAQDKRVARAIDWLTEGTENPYAAVFAAAAPLILQVIRNHEPQLEVKPRGLKIPFTKGKRFLNFKFGVKLGRLRPITNDPDAMTNHVFTNPDIIRKLVEQGILSVAPTGGDQ